MSGRLVVLGAALLVLAACSRDDHGPPPKADLEPARWVSLAPDGAIHVLADDVDGDGRTDLVFTSHGAGYVEVFFQRAPREFEAGPRLTDIAGYHPNDVVRLPGSPRRYLINAEGDSALRVIVPVAYMAGMWLMIPWLWFRTAGPLSFF